MFIFLSVQLNVIHCRQRKLTFPVKVNGTSSVDFALYDMGKVFQSEMEHDVQHVEPVNGHDAKTLGGCNY